MVDVNPEETPVPEQEDDGQKEAKKEAKPKKPKSEVDEFGLRKSSIRSQVAAFYARKEGATLKEVREEFGRVYLNVLTDLEKKGFTVKREKVPTDGKREVTRYYLIRNS